MEPAGVDSSTNGSMDPNWEMEHMARPTYFFFFFLCHRRYALWPRMEWSLRVVLKS